MEFPVLLKVSEVKQASDIYGVLAAQKGKPIRRRQLLRRVLVWSTTCHVPYLVPSIHLAS